MRPFRRASGRNDAVEAAIKNYEMAFRMQIARARRARHRPQRNRGDKEAIRHRLDRRVQAVVWACNASVHAGWSNRASGSWRSPVPLGQSNGTWDQHGNLKAGHEKNALDTDQAIAGLIRDLKARGLFDETLVIWAGEFGRTPHSAGRDGRDHHPEGFSVWLAGGGVKGGTVYGATDELGMHAVEERLHHPRPSCHDSAPAWPRPRTTDVPVRRPRFPADRCSRPGCEARAGLGQRSRTSAAVLNAPTVTDLNGAEFRASTQWRASTLITPLRNDTLTNR